MKKRIIATLMCLAILVSVLVVVPQSDAGVSTFNITSASKTIQAGASFQIKLNGLKASKVKWSSSNKSVATVNKNGLVKGVKKGKAIVTGKYKGVKFQINVTVTPKFGKTINAGDTTLAFVKKGYENHYDSKYYCITFNFTNNSSKPHYFAEYFSYDSYVDNIGSYEYTNDNEYTSVKNGASVEVKIYFEASKSQKFEFLLYKDSNKLVYSCTN